MNNNEQKQSWDVFISYASEDRETVAAHLVLVSSEDVISIKNP
ncbi:MAG: hypothetical protein R2764_23915 [Bacteroidales bacterium]